MLQRHSKLLLQDTAKYLLRAGRHEIWPGPRDCHMHEHNYRSGAENHAWWRAGTVECT